MGTRKPKLKGGNCGLKGERRRRRKLSKARRFEGEEKEKRRSKSCNFRSVEMEAEGIWLWPVGRWVGGIACCSVSVGRRLGRVFAPWRRGGGVTLRPSPPLLSGRRRGGGKVQEG